MRTRFLMFTLFLTGFALVVQAEVGIDEGRQIFTSRCASCHAIDRKLIGPALSGIEDRRSIEWIVRFVHSSQKMIKEGDVEAAKLFHEYNKIVMPDHPDLSDGQIKSIMAHIKIAGTGVQSKGIADISSSDYLKPYKNKRSFIDKIIYLNLDNNQQPFKKDDYMSWLLMAVAILILILSLHFLTYVKSLKSEKNQD